MMKHILTAAVLLASVSASALDQVAAEDRFNSFLEAIHHDNTKSVLVVNEQDGQLLVDALWEAHSQGVVPMRLRRTLSNISEDGLSLTERLRLAVLRKRVGMKFNRRELGTALFMGLSDQKEGERLALQIISLRSDLRRMGMTHVVTTAKMVRPVQTAMSLAVEDQGNQPFNQTGIAKDLWDHTPDLATFMNGKYEQGIRLYMFCRSNRDYPCLQIARDKNHEPVRLEDGTLWSSKSLAKSARGLPSNRTNGNTPTGIHTINGVMPYPDQVPSFGKFRRLILDFVPKSSNEQLQRALLPESSQGSNWWRPNVVARDMGRSLFRIHGTGRPVADSGSPWFPFRPTSGCIAKRENTYGDVEYRDQQDLLNTLMAALDLPVAYENETQIKGLLFFIELDDKAAEVTLADLKEIGIE